MLAALEQWKPVVGYENLYEISPLGIVRNSRTLRHLKPEGNGEGARRDLTVKLHDGRSSRRRSINSLIFRTFGIRVDGFLVELSACVEDFENRVMEADGLGQIPKERQRDQRPTIVFRSLLTEKLRYYGALCRYCKIPLVQGENLTWDHAIPVSRNGPEMIANLVPCCRSCNSRKRTKTIFEFLGKAS